MPEYWGPPPPVPRNGLTPLLNVAVLLRLLYTKAPLGRICCCTNQQKYYNVHYIQLQVYRGHLRENFSAPAGYGSKDSWREVTRRVHRTTGVHTERHAYGGDGKTDEDRHEV